MKSHASVFKQKESKAAVKRARTKSKGRMREARLKKEEERNVKRQLKHIHDESWSFNFFSSRTLPNRIKGFKSSEFFKSPEMKNFLK